MSLQFDEQAAKTLERMYQTPDVVGQRARFHQTLALRKGERVLDVGVGPGLLAREMADSVGETGRIAGIDQSVDMLKMTETRCSELPHTEFREADATKLPYPDESFDAVVSTQVYEYVPDMGKALSEAARVLRKGGRIQILDTAWDSVVWNTSDSKRMNRVMNAWDEHLHHPNLPTTLGTRLRKAGFDWSICEIIPIINASFHSNCYSHGISAAIRQFVTDRQGITRDEASAWRDEFKQQEEEGRYFFSLNRYLFAGIKH